MTTGQGCSTMMRSRQASPSICGIWMSSVTTSGLEAIEQRQRLQPVAGELAPRNRLRAENLAQQLAHQRGIVDDQDLGHMLRLRRSSPGRASSRPRSAASAVRRDRAAGSIRPAFSRLITPVDQANRFVGQVGRRLDRARRRTAALRTRNRRSGRRGGARCGRRPGGGRRCSASGRHVEAPALVDDRQHVAAQVDHAFEEFRAPWAGA